MMKKEIMRPCKRSFIFGLMLFFMAFISIAILGKEGWAHVDYSGDVHPVVTIENDKFVVSYHNNETDKYYRMVLSAEGKVLTDKEPLSSRPPDGALYPIGDPVAGIPAPLIDDLEIHDVIKNQQDTVILATPRKTRGKPVRPCDHLSDDFFFYHLKGQPPSERIPYKIGRPSYIYCFPVCSKIAVYKDNYVVCWIGGKQMNLTMWNPQNGKTYTSIIRENADWNTSISIGIINDRLLIAYHGRGFFSGSVIRTTVINLRWFLM